MRDRRTCHADAIVGRLELYGAERAKDYRFFIENKDGIWGAARQRRDRRDQRRHGPRHDPGSNMVGPAVRTERQAAALIKRELNR